MSEIVVCITTFNEQETIYELVRELILAGYEVIVSDGGSTDQTVHCAKMAGATVLTSDTRRPIRQALLKAYLFASKTGKYARYVQMDAGGSHSAADIPYLLSLDADMVLGSRFLPGSVYEGRRWRAILSRLAARACNFAQPDAAYSDWTSGFRAYNNKAILCLTDFLYQSSMHGWQVETLFRLHRFGLNIGEVSITYRAGASSFNWRIALEAFNVWFYFFRSNRL